MNVEIYLKNHYFPWATTEGNSLKCWLKGDLFYNNKILQGSGVLSLFSSLPSSSEMYHDALKDLLRSFNGSFALVIETPEYLLSIVDRLRSIPLFYTKTDTRFILSDDANYIRDQIKSPFNEKNGAEFLVTGYVTGRETLFEGIYQIQEGEYLWYTKNDTNITTAFYHRYWHENFFSDSEEELLKRLDEVFVHVFQRLIASTKERKLQIVVPLSGGLDSRIIVAMLKRLGVDDVICFSYGKKGNYEAEISKKVAEALGYQWYFVEYTYNKLYQCYHSDEMRVYERYAGNLVSLPEIQDFLAVQELQKEGKILKKSVIVPGHSGDMLAGSWIPHTIEEMAPDYNQFITHTLQKHYLLRPWNESSNNQELEAIFRKRIRKSVGDIDIRDAESLANTIEYFNGYERQGKFIVNSVRVYEFLGFEWKIPLWDAELMDFFLKLELKFRINQYLYHKYILFFLINTNFPILKCIPNTSTATYIPQKFNTYITKYITKIVMSTSFCKSVARKIVMPYRIIKLYYFNILNFNYIMSIREFLLFYPSYVDINTYLSQKYLKNTLLRENMDNLLKRF